MDVKTRRPMKDNLYELNRVKRRFAVLNREHALILDSVTEGIFGLDRMGRVTFINPAAAKMLGWNAREILGEDLHRMIHRNEVNEAPYHRDECSVCAAFKDGEIHRANDEVFWTKNGKNFPAEYTSTPIREGETIVGSVVTFRDITERMRAAEALEQSEDRFSKAFHGSPLGIVMTKVEDGVITDANDAYLRMIAFERDEVIGRNSVDLKLLPDTKYRDALLSELKQHGRFVNKEFRIRRKNGEFRDILVNGQLLTAGGERYILTLLDDVTERKLSEEKIREQAALLDVDPDAIYVRDMEDRILFWNKGAARLYGWTANEILGKQVTEFIYKEIPPQFEEAKQTVLQDGEWKGEWHHRTREGKEVIVGSQWTLVRDKSGKPKMVYVVNSDITGRKQLEAQFLRAQRMESIGTLAGGIAHDLNNVLSPILMGIQILRKKYQEPEHSQLLDILDASAQRGVGLIRQVLTFARGIEGEHSLLQVRHLIAEVEQIAKDTFKRSITIRHSVAKDLWTINGDATQLHQVLMNLCVNARDAMPDGGILKIEAENSLLDAQYARMHVDAKPGPYVLLNVSDTGSGIPQGIIDKIFDPFFTTKEIGKGTGLGLSTVIGIVKSHGGFVNVYSEVGKGTQFKVYLPAVENTDTQTARQKQEELPLGNGETILVVDDELAVREITKTSLETFGYSVQTANDGAEAIALYAQQGKKISAVITDMMMPYMDGPATIRALQKLNPVIKIIAVSGLVENQKITEITDSRSVKFIQKPFTTEKLLLILRELLVAG